MSTKKKLHPSVLQTSEFRECILLPNITRRRLEHSIAHANSFDKSANPPGNLRRSASQQRRRREFRHVRLRFLQILIDLCKLVLKKLLEHSKVVISDRLVMANVVEPAHAPDTPTCPL